MQKSTSQRNRRRYANGQRSFFLYVIADWIHNIADSAFMLTPGSIITLSVIEYICTTLTEIHPM